MSGRKKSGVWTFYSETDEPNKVKCTLCESLISRGGSGRSASTSALSNHLGVKHSREFLQMQHPIHTPNLPSTSNTNDSQPSTLQVASSSRQLSIEDSLESSWKINDPRAQAIHKTTAEMIAVDNQPLSILEDQGFSRLMSLLKPKYQVPSRKYMSETVIPKVYEQLKKTVSEQISSAKSISVTSDLWTCMNNLLCFLSFTVHWLDNNFSAQNRVLAMKSFDQQHTGENIRQVLEEIANDWKITQKIHVIVTDNGRNIVKAVNDSPFTGK